MHVRKKKDQNYLKHYLSILGSANCTEIGGNTDKKGLKKPESLWETLGFTCSTSKTVLRSGHVCKFMPKSWKRQ